MKYFETEYGKRIPIIDGYFQTHKKRAGADEILAIQSSVPERRKSLSYSAFLKDIYLYSLLIDLLRDHGIDLNVESALDVGGGEGTMARLLKMEGRAKHTHVIELYDMRGLLTDDLFDSHISRWRRNVLLSGLGLNRYSAIKQLSLFESFQSFPGKDSTFFNLRRKNYGRIADYTLRNFYEMEQKFDLVTAFSCVDYFNPELFFKKAGDVLNDGGIFYAHLAYWWYPVNCSLVIGDFPYASQRLSKSDFQRYLRQFRPNEYDDTMERYNYFHLGEHHPTLDEYVEYADRAGFSLIDARRMYGGRGKLTPFTPFEYNQFADAPLSEVLQNIHDFNPRVGLTDLYTFNALVVFQKRNSGCQALRTSIPSSSSVA
jgi:SAM-dependent methyltransferase